MDALLTSLESIDVSLFYFVNHALQNFVFDWFMPFITDLNKHKLVLWIVALLLLWMFVQKKPEIRFAAIALLATVILSDQFSSHVLKYLVERPRPCHVLLDVHLLVDCGSGYSFPSSHAVNNFAAALVLSFFFPRAAWGWFLFAATVAFSRIYVGVHYPSDVVAGALIGIAVGWLVLQIALTLRRLVVNRRSASNLSDPQ